MQHVLVTGGNGFIGRYVVEELKERGYVVSVFDRHSYHTHPSITPPHTEGMFFGDIKDPVLVNDAIAHVDGVIHLAGVLGTQETVANPVPAAKTNILGGMNVLEACAQYDVPMVNIAVGNWWMSSPYSITKNTIERFVDMYVRFRGSRMTVVRALNAYGPRQVAAAPYGPSRVRKIMPSFICRALDGLPIEIYGEGDQIMDMIYVEDVAEILVSALEQTESGEAIGKVFEAGTGRETTVNMIAEEVVRNIPDTEIVHLPMRPGEDEHAVVLGNPDTLEPLGLDHMLTPLEDGVRVTVDYFKDYFSHPKPS